MSKFTKLEIDRIQECIKECLIKEADSETFNERDNTYIIYKKFIDEGEELLKLMESLREEDKS
jgi:hypothetical protein